MIFADIYLGWTPDFRPLVTPGRHIFTPYLCDPARSVVNFYFRTYCYRRWLPRLILFRVQQSLIAGSRPNLAVLGWDVAVHLRLLDGQRSCFQIWSAPKLCDQIWSKPQRLRMKMTSKC